MPYFFLKRAQKWAKQNFKRELFQVISLNLAIYQEIKQGEKKTILIVVFSTPLPMEQMTYKLG